MTSPFRRLRWLWPLLAAPAIALSATKGPAPCPPCGEWALDVGSSDDAQAAVETALKGYKPPRMRRPRFTPGDIDSESAAEVENSLFLPPGARRQELRDELGRLARIPPTLKLRQEGGDIVIDQGPNDRRRFTPGEPHSRVDTRGTARIVAKLDRGALSVSEQYDGKTENRESYRADAAGLTVTRVIERRGLPTVTVHSRYTAAPR